MEEASCCRGGGYASRVSQEGSKNVQDGTAPIEREHAAQGVENAKNRLELALARWRGAGENKSESSGFVLDGGTDGY